MPDDKDKGEDYVPTDMFGNPLLFVLVDNKPVGASVKDYAQFKLDNKHIVQRTEVTDDVLVSTVFLGMNEGFLSRTPLYFETMVFGGEHHGVTHRYETYEQAVAGHEETLLKLFDCEK